MGSKRLQIRANCMRVGIVTVIGYKLYIVIKEWLFWDGNIHIYYSSVFTLYPHDWHAVVTYVLAT